MTAQPDLFADTDPPVETPMATRHDNYEGGFYFCVEGHHYVIIEDYEHDVVQIVRDELIVGTYPIEDDLSSSLPDEIVCTACIAEMQAERAKKA